MQGGVGAAQPGETPWGPLVVPLHPPAWQPQRIICGARSPLLRDLLPSCKLGFFTPNKAGYYLPVKRPIDGGGQWAAPVGPGEGGGGGCPWRAGDGAGTVIKPFPAGLSFISSRGRVIFLLETIWRERGGRGARKILNRHCSQHNTPCQEQVKTSPCGIPAVGDRPPPLLAPLGS